MSADLFRIEYKLDLIVSALQQYGIMLENLPPMEGIRGDFCPACREPIAIRLNLTSETVERHCGCKMPMSVVPGISALLAPPKETTHGHLDRTDEERVSPDEEEGGAGSR